MLSFKLCEEKCPNWAQWKVQVGPEKADVRFLCGRHMEEFVKQNPEAKKWFCGAVPLVSA